ncbi:MAG: hypothetical protein EZS28_049485 [Streblomastix strix]|uniref:Uncharacterized protein n=1 Tax=Streblomastix strix TaxID=222440 RepID=A0A5J4T9R8_9EUKA|nr:MAG: hypothetical protein EZS28_049485 [Streblomastix strix]
MNDTFSKIETHQKMTYAQVSNCQEEQLRFYMKHGPKAWLIANGKMAGPVALLSLPSAQPSSGASSIDDSNQDLLTQQKKKHKRTEKYSDQY